MNINLFGRSLLLSAGILALSGGLVFAADRPIKIGGMASLLEPGTVVGVDAMRDAMLVAEENINVVGGVLCCD